MKSRSTKLYNIAFELKHKEEQMLFINRRICPRHFVLPPGKEFFQEESFFSSKQKTVYSDEEEPTEGPTG